MVEITSVDPEHPDAQRCIACYVAELNRIKPFDPTAGVTALPHELRAPAGEMFVVYRDEEAVGCGAVKHKGDDVSELKRMWLADALRGEGLGRRLLERLEQAAIAAGAATLRMETNRALVAAVALYESAGYREVEAFNDEPFADLWLEKPVPADG